jgi:hypothetical protein
MGQDSRFDAHGASRAELLDYIGKVDPAMVRWMKNNTLDELREVVHELEAIGEATEEMETAVQELAEAQHEVEVLGKENAVHKVRAGHLEGEVEAAEA